MTPAGAAAQTRTVRAGQKYRAFIVNFGPLNTTEGELLFAIHGPARDRLRAGLDASMEP